MSKPAPPNPPPPGQPPGKPPMPQARAHPPPQPQQYRRPPPRSPPASPPAAAAPRAPPRAGRFAPYILGGGAFALGIYTVSLYVSLSSARGAAPAVPPDVSDRYDATAATFDAAVGRQELFTGLLWRRRQLARRARGDVLEASCGTGRNVAYYRLGRCRSVTMLDQSAPMVEVAREKWRKKRPAWKNVRFVTQSALEPLPPPPPPPPQSSAPASPASSEGYGKAETRAQAREEAERGDGPRKYDTVIQTMGLCSTPSPAALLRNLGAACKPDGQILLLEHGRSYYGWLNRLLDATAPAHADRHGCWWNKDIGAIVEDSGLEVVRVKRFHLGTTWWVELRPGRGEGRGKGGLGVEEGMRGRLGVAAEKGEGGVGEEAQRPRRQWWEVWR